jgi:uncharacterized protein (TIGR02569 family)
MSTRRPPARVCAAFGISAEPVPLPGGEGLSFRAGEFVLKRMHDPDEAEWTQSLVARIDQQGFRVPEPIPANTGRWVHDHWTASRYVSGLRSATPRWQEIVDVGLRFCDAAEAARHGGRDVLTKRTHRWAVADRVAWGEADVELGEAARHVMESIRPLLSDATRDEQFVHGDLSGNVMVTPDGTPVILDVSPYLRPRRWAAAIVIADAVLWNNADLSLARSFADSPENRDLFGRALIFRMVAEQLADDPRHDALLAPYRRVLSEC